MFELGLTKREKILLLILALLGIIFLFIPQQTINEIEILLYIIFTPFLIWVFSDQQRRK